MRFEQLRQPHRLDGRQTLMHVVKQVDAEPQGLAKVIEKGHDAPCVASRVVVGAGHRPVGRGGECLATAVAAPLGPDVLIPLRHELPHPLLDLLQSRAVSMAVYRGALTALPAQELVHGQSGELAQDVPQRHVHAGERVVHDRPATPVGVDVDRLPDVLDAARIAADE